MPRSTGRVAVLLVIITGIVLRFATASPLWLYVLFVNVVEELAVTPPAAAASNPMVPVL